MFRTEKGDNRIKVRMRKSAMTSISFQNFLIVFWMRLCSLNMYFEVVNRQ